MWTTAFCVSKNKKKTKQKMNSLNFCDKDGLCDVIDGMMEHRRFWEKWSDSVCLSESDVRIAGKNQKTKRTDNLLEQWSRKWKIWMCSFEQNHISMWIIQMC